MSKVTMPSPAHRGPAGAGSYFDSYSKQQMEAYANARVREALENAAQVILDGIGDDSLIASLPIRRNASNEVLALIPEM